MDELRDYKNTLSYETLREECFYDHECEYCENDYDEVEDSDGMMCPVESWWCSAQEGDFCKRLNRRFDLQLTKDDDMI